MIIYKIKFIVIIVAKNRKIFPKKVNITLYILKNYDIINKR